VGAPVAIVLGKGGLGWGRGVQPERTALDGPDKREGDGRSPAGAFRLLQATGYDPAPPPRTTLRYQMATERLRCVDDAEAAAYNQLVLAPVDPPPWKSAELMRRADDLYRWTIVVEHNRSPVIAGRGSCVFLHVWAGPRAPTVGCTAMAAPHMRALVAWLDASAQPLLVQLPRAAYRALAARWDLPPLSANAR
jgi:L,D-peptidoglycan transpeptidase YkuD (ErfK/YbiS/YcfS/YnhG family)